MFCSDGFDVKECRLPLQFFLMPVLFFTLTSPAQIEWAEYPYPISKVKHQQIRFGYLTVPETRNTEHPQDLKIGFCILKSNSPKPVKDAVIYLPGGPGQGYTHGADYFLESKAITRLLEERDIVLFDPRGCGTSEPQLCYGLEDPEIINANLTGISIDEYWEGIGRVMEACRDSLRAAGMHAEAYGSADIAHDVEDLREALGYEQWNIRGHSYGTRYAQSIIRFFPDRVRSAVLSGIVPSAWSYEDRNFYGFVYSLRKVIDQCAADPDCNRAFPELETNLYKILKRLKAEPIVLPRGTLSILPESLVIINPKLVLDGIFKALYIREGVEMVPLLVHTAANGHDWIAEALTIAWTIDFQIDGDMYQLIRCNDNPGYRFAPSPIVNDTLVSLLYYYWRGNQQITEETLCHSIGVDLDSLEQQAVYAELPIMLYSGEFDPVTPPYHADSVARYFKNVTNFVVPGRSHDAPIPMADVMADFFINPENNPDLRFLDKLEPPQFLVDVALNKGISAIAIKMAKKDSLFILITVGIIGLMILTGFLYFSVLIFNRNTIQGAFKKYYTIWLLLFVATVLILMFAMAIKEALATHLYLPVFGLPKKWIFLFYFPWIIPALAAMNIVDARKIILAHETGLVRFFWVAGWVGSISLFLWLLYWGII